MGSQHTASRDAIDRWLEPVHAFLLCPTPAAWIDRALENLPLLLIDHANCEKKAASTALSLMYRHIDNYKLQHKLSRLAREELRHYEQVMAIMQRRGIRYQAVSAARYAQGLMSLARSAEPGRLVDTLVTGAVIEARSCERFAALAPHLDDELRAFYLSLLKSESRHFEDYLALARDAGGDAAVADSQARLLARDAELVQSPDTELRFHSGIPL